MKVHNDPQHQPLTSALRAALAEIRAERAFDPVTYTQAKVHAIRTYWAACGLKAAVVSVSGGLDSATVLALLARASNASYVTGVQTFGAHLRGISPADDERTPPPGPPTILAVLQPVHVHGATRQDDATALGRAACDALGIEPHVVELAPLHALLAPTVQAATKLPGDDWADGQLVAHLRVPVLAYSASLLTAAGMPAVIVGTTNRDEGAYLGYVGKFSDGMVDVQPISDLHKSEVRALAEYLGVPQAILDATPSGDMYDGRSDTDVFGASYDFVELYLSLKKKMGYVTTEDEVADALGETGLEALAAPDAATTEQVRTLGGHLETLHRYNAHKYSVESPAVHFDILPTDVPGGWRRQSTGQMNQSPLDDVLSSIWRDSRTHLDGGF